MKTFRRRQDRVIGDRFYGLMICLRLNGIPPGRCLWDTRMMVQMSRCSIPLAFSHRLRKSGRKPITRVCQPPVPPRWSEQSICRRWDWWRPSNSLRLRGRDSGPRSPLRRSPSRIWGIRRFHCPLIASKWGDRRRFRKTGVCLMCRQFRRNF